LLVTNFYRPEMPHQGRGMMCSVKRPLITMQNLIVLLYSVGVRGSHKYFGNAQRWCPAHLGLWNPKTSLFPRWATNPNLVVALDRTVFTQQGATKHLEVLGPRPASPRPAP